MTRKLRLEEIDCETTDADDCDSVLMCSSDAGGNTSSAQTLAALLSLIIAAIAVIA